MNVKVNGVDRPVEARDEATTLLEWLRERLDLTGAKNGCGIGRCGACTVLVDDRPTLACRTAVRDVAGKSVRTIEGMAAADGALHPLQQSLLTHRAPSREEIRKAISPNLCRCTGYQQIIDAIEAAAPAYESVATTPSARTSRS